MLCSMHRDSSHCPISYFFNNLRSNTSVSTHKAELILFKSLQDRKDRTPPPFFILWQITCYTVYFIVLISTGNGESKTGNAAELCAQ